jgi:hypothetical protein
VAPLLGWNETEQARQIAACQAIHDRNLAELHAPAEGIPA